MKYLAAYALLVLGGNSKPCKYIFEDKINHAFCVIKMFILIF